MGNYSNTTGVSLPLAVWLATDNYDGKPGTNSYSISATSLLKSIKQIVLGLRAAGDDVIDVNGLVQSRIGNAIHDAIERAWTDPQRLIKTIVSLGYTEELAKRVVVNPVGPVTEGSIPVYMEQRGYKKLGRWTITGKFGFVFDGALTDFKSTGVFTYVNKTKDKDYILQGSIYRWLHPNIITKDQMSIDFIFTDWKKMGLNNPNYPASRLLNERLPLKPIEETEQWLAQRLTLVDTLELTPEPDLPHCNDEELWRSESVFKYYKSGVVGPRSTKNFDNAADAYTLQRNDGGKGLVLEIKGSPTACLYCNVSSLCTQKNAYIHSGELVI